MSSRVTAIPAAEPDLAAHHFESHLTFETDCWDVHASIADGCKDFVLLDVRSVEAFARGHVPGAISLPHASIDEAALTSYPKNSLFVVYCAGPHCNGAHRAAIRLGRLGRKVKVMIGGITGWLDEGFTLERAGARDAADSAGA
jgi:rhodanese-related sulfurtransferase